MRIIDLEAHFYTQEYIEYLRGRKEVPREDRDESGIITPLRTLNFTLGKSWIRLIF